MKHFDTHTQAGSPSREQFRKWRSLWSSLAGRFNGPVTASWPRTKLLGDEKVERDRVLHWCYFATYQMYTLWSSLIKGGQVKNPGGEWKKYLKWITPTMVLNGLVSKLLLYTAGIKEESWNTFDWIWNTALFAITAGLDVYTAVDAFFLGDEIVEWKQNASDVIKVGVSIAGVVLLGIRIDAWVNKKSPQSDLFQTRDVLNSIVMMFAFDDTSRFIKAVGRDVPLYLIYGETYVKVAAGAVHIAAVETS